MKPEQIRRYAAAPVPRYTSYPTAPHFHDGIGPDVYRTWLSEIAPGSRLSLYVHVPFCDTLCWFCGCHTKITRKYKPIAAYLETLIAEARHVAAALPAGVEVGQIHWGGGSPTILEADDVKRLASALAAALPDRRWTGKNLDLRPSDNYPAMVRVASDPRHFADPSSREIWGLVQVMDAAAAAAPQVEIPVLTLMGARDMYLRPDRVRAIHERAPGAAGFREYPEGWHWLFRDLQREAVWRDVAEFVLDLE